MSDLVSHEEIISTITRLIDAGKLPHLGGDAGLLRSGDHPPLEPVVQRGQQRRQGDHARRELRHHEQRCHGGQGIRGPCCMGIVGGSREFFFSACLVLFGVLNVLIWLFYEACYTAFHMVVCQYT